MTIPRLQKQKKHTHTQPRSCSIFIQKKLLNELSKMILEEKVDKNSLIVVDDKNGELVFKNK